MSFVQTNLAHDDRFAGAASTAFGPFQLNLRRRQLLRHGEPVSLGGRAMDLLIALASRPGEIIPHQDLFRAIWLGQPYVEEANLRVHIGALRKALGSDDANCPFIYNISGRGYRLDARPEGPMSSASLPAQPSPLVGREACLEDLSAQMIGERLMTLTGPGGVGKSSLAVAIAHSLASNLDYHIAYFDFSAGRPNLDALSSLVRPVSAPRSLVVFDNCDRTIDLVAAVVDATLRTSDTTQFLATCREPLRIPNERIRKISPLGLPRAAANLTAIQAQNYAALEWFILCAEASLHGFQLQDFEVGAARNICLRLDGNPLAIQLIAARTGIYGVCGLEARMMDEGFLLHGHWRAASPRHRSVADCLAWSLDGLPEEDLHVLLQLAAAVRPLSAAEVCGKGGVRVETLAGLAEKSLVEADFTSSEATYFVPNLLRAYLGARARRQ